MFSNATIATIKSYVYVLTDDDDRIFYVGKGEGNRVFDHVEEVRALIKYDPLGLLTVPEDDETEQDGLTPKRSLIAKLLKSNKSPGMYVVREGLTKNEALLIEAVLISVLEWQFKDSLRNSNAGHGTRHYGLKSVYELEATRGEPFRVNDLPNVSDCEEVIAINVNRRWAEVTSGTKTLLEVSAGVWKLDVNRAKNCRYAIIHANGIVRGVYCISGWTGPNANARFSFVAEPSLPLEGDQFKNKNASSLFGKSGSGSQNPIRYVKVK